MIETQIISSVYRQKSKIFLWPLLGIPRNTGFRPIKTYLSDTHKNITHEDYVLIAPFKKDGSDCFGSFEEDVLLSNDFYSDFYETKEYLVYIFDLSPLKEDYDKIIKGQYSKLSKSSKTVINRFFGSTKLGIWKPHPQVDAYLNPNKEIYIKVANQLGIDAYELAKNIEILDPPNLEKEVYDESKINEEQRSNNTRVSN